MKTNKIFTTLLLSAMLVPGAVSAQDRTKLDTLIAKPWGITKSLSENASNGFSYTAAALEDKPVMDLRSRLTGLIPGLEVIELSGGIERNNNLGTKSMTSSQEKLINRGFSNIVCIVDDMPVAFNQYLMDPSQIQSVTLLSEVADKAMYGPMASGGAVYIRTKSGEYNTPLKVSVDVESGISQPTIWPEWVDGVTYAQLNNQARAASGHEQLYSAADIKGFGNNDMYDREYPNVDYKSIMYRNLKPVTKMSVNFFGGSSNVRYNMSLSGLNDNNLEKVGDMTDNNRLTMTANVDARIGQWIEAGVKFTGMTSFYRGQNGSFTAYRDTPAVAFPVVLGQSAGSNPDELGLNGINIYSISKAFTSNPYAQLVDGGFYTTKHRSGMFTAFVDVNLGWLVKGLKSRTSASINTYFNQKVGKENDYFAYYWDRSTGIDELSSHKGDKASEKSVIDNFTFQGFNFFERLYWGKKFGNSKLDAGLTYFMSDDAHVDNSYYERTQTLILNADYAFNDKLFVDAVVDYSGSSRLKKGNRFAFFPTLAVAYKPLDNLKVHIQAGIIGDNDVFGTHYLYQGEYKLSDGVSFGQHSSNTWFGGTDQRKSSYTTISRIANPELTWAKDYQIDFGVDYTLAGCVDIMANIFRIEEKGIITNTSTVYPTYTGTTSTEFYENFNETARNGFELAVNFHKTIGDFRIGAGAWASHTRIVDTKLANDVYAYDWQKKTGVRSDAYWGYECIGRFKSQSEIESSALYNSNAQVGDLKYADLNKDGTIDTNDQKVIGHTTPTLGYAVTIDLGYKAFDFCIVGTGRAGFQTALTNEYFWNGWSDGNYSAFVAENIGGDYPRLNYEKAENNFVKSSFWLKDGGYFKIQSAELGYTHAFGAKSPVKGMRICLRGSNLLTFTKIKYVDPENTAAGVTTYPLLRTVTAGIKLNF